MMRGQSLLNTSTTTSQDTNNPFIRHQHPLPNMRAIIPKDINEMNRALGHLYAHLG